jgi:hypothetical protein
VSDIRAVVSVCGVVYCLMIPITSQQTLTSYPVPYLPFPVLPNPSTISTYISLPQSSHLNVFFFLHAPVYGRTGNRSNCDAVRDSNARGNGSVQYEACK